MRDEITYQFPKCSVVEVWGLISFFHAKLHERCNYLSMLELKLIHVGKGTLDIIYVRTKMIIAGTHYAI